MLLKVKGCYSFDLYLVSIRQQYGDVPSNFLKVGMLEGGTAKKGPVRREVGQVTQRIELIIKNNLTIQLAAILTSFAIRYVS